MNDDEKEAWLHDMLRFGTGIVRRDADGSLVRIPYIEWADVETDPDEEPEGA